jgi:hypothetical protein
MKVKCGVGKYMFGEAKHCEALRWDKQRLRYVCELAVIPNLAEMLYIGEGCCANMNTWRHDVKHREIDEQQ